MSTPISGPYTGVPASPYHVNTGQFNRVVTATATFFATGSNANPAAFYVSGSAGATVTLINGGTLSLPAPGAANPAIIHNIGVYSVTAGTVFLLYR